MDFAIHIAEKEAGFIQALVDREEWAQRALYKSLYSRMMGVCRRYANNSEDALDIMQDGFVKVFCNISKYHPGTSLEAWVRRIMINTCIDYYRKEQRRQTNDLETAAPNISYDPTVLQRLGHQEILQAMQELPAGYRAVFNLFVIEGYSHREIARTLDIAESTSRSNLLKARTLLKKYLQKKGIDNKR